MEEETIKTHKKRYDWLKPYQFVKGGEGGPGRPKGKTLKEFAREYLESLPDDRKIEYLATLSEEMVWQMAEGRPQQTVDGSLDVKVGKLEELQGGLKDILNDKEGKNQKDS